MSQLKQMGSWKKTARSSCLENNTKIAQYNVSGETIHNQKGLLLSVLVQMEKGRAKGGLTIYLT